MLSIPKTTLEMIDLSQVVAFFGSITDVYQVANGLGRHISTLTAEEESGFLKWTLIAEVQLIIGTCLTKLSVSVFILRILNRTRKKTTYLIYTLMITLVVTTLALAITFLLRCRPFNAVYDPSVHGKCYSNHVVFGVAYGQGGELFKQIPVKAIANSQQLLVLSLTLSAPYCLSLF